MSLFLSASLRLYQKYLQILDRLSTKRFIASISEIGPRCRCAHPSYLHGGQFIRVGTDFVSGPGLRLNALQEYAGDRFTPRITIGDRMMSNFGLHVAAIGSVEIGDDVLIGSHVLITDHQHGAVNAAEAAIAPIARRLNVRGQVKIGNRVWIGDNACIFGGVEIGDGSIIGANSVVTRSVPPGSVVAGVPGRVIKTIDQTGLSK